MGDVLIDLISSVGFPIVAFLLMYRLVDGQLKSNTEALIMLKEVINDLSHSIKERG